MRIRHNRNEGTNTITLHFTGHLADEVKNDFFSTMSTSSQQHVSLYLDDETVLLMADQFASLARSLCKEEVAS